MDTIGQGAKKWTEKVDTIRQGAKSGPKKWTRLDKDRKKVDTMDTIGQGAKNTLSKGFCCGSKEKSNLGTMDGIFRTSFIYTYIKINV